MSSVVISGDTSGTITLQAPAVSGSSVLTLPATTATLATLTTPSFASTIGVGGTTAANTGAGITFPATQSASSDANTLDDYEEGTWTPTLGGNATYISRTATYTKIGRSVFIFCDITVNVLGTGSTQYLQGIPFTTLSGYYPSGGVSYFANLAASVYFISPQMTTTTTIAFISTTSLTPSCTNAPAIFGNGTRLVFSMTYEAA